ncbi:ROK family protein [Egicoccus halophilus]|uniref:Glucokinase n=1 Tax=Egicoccus halophilus TaxID=1670830 RepID=A0A8J3EV18_9ACTN|nr:ROK family protein [Egicoccus halophilus]GGI08290.1 glucokinase [Egicoccus halophilus]
MVTVGIDLGGTNIYAVVLDGEERLGRAKLRTPSTGDRTGVIDVMDAAVRDALGDAGRDIDEVTGVGVGSPGVVMAGTVGGASNVPGFLERFSLADLLKQKVGREVRVTNDVTAAAVAEHRLGAGRGTDDLLAVHVGTGVGGGIILGGRPFEGGAGGAGEFGHIVVRQGGAVCPCGRRGCVEAYAGRRAMTLAAERAKAAGTSTILFDVMEDKGKARATSGVFAAAYERGDTLVADLLDDAIEALGAGIASAVNLLDVDVVVLGGGFADRFGGWFRSRVDAAMRPHLFLQPPRIRVVAAELGDEGGAIGAALLAAEI